MPCLPGFVSSVWGQRNKGVGREVQMGVDIKVGGEEEYVWMEG
jgi:hypothetical protein